MKQHPTGPERNDGRLNRRRFLSHTGTAALALSLASPSRVVCGESRKQVTLGLIGCGGRGKWIADLFNKHGGYRIAAVADYFPDQADAAGNRFQVPENRRYAGLNGYKQLLETKPDAVAIESPPFFHPEQAAVAVSAGCHVYLAKPVAVDVPGSLSVEQSGIRAGKNKLVFLVDFQTRTQPLLRDFAVRIAQGEIGRIASAEAAYQTGPVGEGVDRARRADPNNPELRLRAWVTDRALSGDIITEQNIHAIDLACWMLNTAPLKAWGRGGKCRDFVGNCWDNFSLIFEYPEGVHLTFSSKQVGFGYEDIMCRVYGTTGTVDAHYFGKVTIKSKEDFAAGDVGDLYRSGAESNIATFHDSIMTGNFTNPTVATSVRSNLATILGRTAAYRQEIVTWDSIVNEAEPLVADLTGLKA